MGEFHVNEWTVVVVIISLAGLIAVIVKPMISLTKSITKLDVSMQNFKEAIDRDHQDNRDEHKELWDKEDEQDQRLNKHDLMISELKTSKERKDP